MDFVRAFALFLIGVFVEKCYKSKILVDIMAAIYYNFINKYWKIILTCLKRSE